MILKSGNKPLRPPLNPVDTVHRSLLLFKKQGIVKLGFHDVDIIPISFRDWGNVSCEINDCLNIVFV